MSANNKLFKLQKILFPTEAICNEEEMYFKGLDFIIGNNKVKFSRGGVLSASTYFNSFSMLKWKRYAGVDNLKLVLDLEGRFQVSVFSMRIRSGKVARTLRSQVQIDASGILDFAIPEAGDEVLYFELVALDDGCVFSGGYYATNLNGRIPNRVKLAIGICTFQREEYIRANSRTNAQVENQKVLTWGNCDSTSQEDLLAAMCDIDEEEGNGNLLIQIGAGIVSPFVAFGNWLFNGGKKM